MYVGRRVFVRVVVHTARAQILRYWDGKSIWVWSGRVTGDDRCRGLTDRLTDGLIPGILTVNRLTVSRKPKVARDSVCPCTSSVRLLDDCVSHLSIFSCDCE